MQERAEQKIPVLELPRNPEIEKLRYSILIIDFHGTMTDHQLRAIRAYHHAAHQAFGIHLGKEFFQETLTRPSHAQKKNPMTNAKFIEEKFKDQKEEDIKKFKELFDLYMDNVYIPIPGIVQAIKQLIEMGVNVSALTNGRNNISKIKEKLAQWGLEDISKRLYSSHVTGARKPDIKTVKHILRDYDKQGVPTPLGNVLIFGDYVDDVQTAHNMGIDSALMIRGNGWETVKIRKPKPTYVVSDLSDLIKIMTGKVEKGVPDGINIQPLLWPNESWGPKK